MDPSLRELYEEGAPDDEVALVLRLADSLVVPDGVRVVARFGDIATCRVRREDILRLHAMEVVRSVKAPRLVLPGWDDDADAGESRPGAPGTSQGSTARRRGAPTTNAGPTTSRRRGPASCWRTSTGAST